MPALAIRGRYHNGTVEPMEPPPVQGDADVVIVFLSGEDDLIWEETAAKDFLSGYSDRDAVYDELQSA